MADAAAAAKPAIAAPKTALVDSLPPDPIAAGLQELCRLQTKLRKEGEALVRPVKTAKQKVGRLKVRAHALSDDDPIAVLMMTKAAASAKAEPGAGRDTGSSASSSSSSSPAVTALARVAANAALAPAAAASSAMSDEDGMVRED